MRIRLGRLALTVPVTLVIGAMISWAISAPTTQATRDLRYQLTIPEGWKADSSPAMQRYDLAMADHTQRCFVMLSSTEKVDLVDQSLAQYEESCAQGFDSQTNEAERGEPSATNIGGFAALQRTIKCTDGTVRWVYQCTVIETDTSFVWIGACSTPSRWEAARPIFEQVVGTFRQVEQGPASRPSNGK